MVRLKLPAGTGKQAEVLGHGPDAAPAVVEVLNRSVSCDRARVHRGPRRRALPPGAGVGAVDRLRCGRDHRDRGRLRSSGLRRDARRRDFAGARPRWSPPGSDRGNELLAHVAAKLDLPMAANCMSVAPGAPATVTRMRWGGSLLEEAQLDAGSPLLITRAARGRRGPVADVETCRSTRSTLDAPRRSRLTERIEADDRRRLAGRRRRGRLRRSRGRLGRGLRR